MAKNSIRTAAIVISIVLVGSFLFSHPDDPKTRDRVRPYAGPGWRIGGGGSVPLGPPPIGFPASGVTLMAWLPLGDFGSGLTSGNDCWGYVSPSGREYALFGHSGGTAFVDVTTPGNPVIVEQITGPTSLWRDIKVYQHYAYAVSEGGQGIQIIDMNGIDNGVVTLVGTVMTGGTSATHNVAIDEVSGYLYRCGGDGQGLRIYSLANPANPTFVAAWPDRYVHDAQIVTYTSGPYAGKEIAFCSTGYNSGWVSPSLDILDVTDKQNILQLSYSVYTSGAYSHQCWLSPDRQYLYLNDELDEDPSYGMGFTTRTLVFDVGDLSNPVELPAFTNGNDAIGHNLYTVGNLLYEANYRSGLRVFDATDPIAPVEIAYFDTWPPDDNKQFNGLWSNYPFFPSGTILGSDLEKGLFVWQLGDIPLIFSYPSGLPALIDPAGATVEVEITEQTPGSFVPGSARLFYDAGAGLVEAPLTSLGGDLFEAAFPALPCGTSVSYFFSAQTTGGAVWTDPQGAPTETYSALVALDQFATFEDDMETNGGWTVGAPGDNASTGIWVRVDPVGTAAQPEDDHTPAPGTRCWVTGQGTPGAPVGDNDVDGGRTTLTSPPLDLSVLVVPTIAYWRWYSNDAGASPNDDTFTVDVSADNGATWVNVETIGPSGDETSGGWFHHEFRVADHVSPSAQVRVRFVAEDAAPGSIVEAAIDDFRVADALCADCNGNGVDDTVDIALGNSSDDDGNGIPDECDCPNPFVRGEINGDGSLDISDAVALLVHLFGSGPGPDPVEAGDVNGDGSMNVGDAVYLLNYLFATGDPPPPPFPNPGC